MVSLRSKYHELENKLSTAFLLASDLGDMVEFFKKNPNDKTIGSDIVKSSAKIQSKIIEATEDITNLKKLIYRSIDPDIDINLIVDKIMEENKKIKLFIADDERDITEALVRKYETEGYMVESALNAEEAIKKIEKFKPNIVITDIYFPDVKGGMDIIKFIRKNMKGVQVLVVSRFDDEDVIADIRSLGVEHQNILIKPVKFAQINVKLSGMILKLKR